MIKKLTVKKDNKEVVYKISCYEWNWFLNRYYPKAVKILSIEHLKKPYKKLNN